MAAPHKPKMAFYSLEDDDPISRGSSGNDSPKVQEHSHYERQEAGHTAPAQLRAKKPTHAFEADDNTRQMDNGSKVRYIKSKALSRNSSTSSTRSDTPVELQPSDFRKHATRCWGAFSNLGFLEGGEQDQDEIEELFVGLSNNVVETERCLEEWEALREQVTGNREAVKQEIEKRKKKMIKRIKDYAQVLHGRLDTMVDPKLESIDHRIENMKEALEESNQLSDGTFINDHKIHRDVKKSRNSLAGLCARLAEGNKEPPKWQNVHLVKTENSHQLITSLFGNLQGGMAEGGVLGEALVAEGREKQRNQSLVLENIEFISTFHVKSSKDSRECGITDVAMTPANQIVIIDKHNKLVKLFDLKGKLEKYIGRGLLKEPSRVSVCRSNGHILVTDNSLKAIMTFRRDGSYIGEFVSDLKYPISHCETYDGKVAVLEYASKTIVLYDASGKTIHTFPTNMVNPAYMGCTSGGNVVVSDWKHNQVKIFDLTGAPVWEYSGKGSQDDEMTLPHGVCGDGFGHVIIAEKGNTRVQIYTENGDHVTYLKPDEKERHHFKLPYAVDTNKYNLLVVAEYQGVVKIFKYLDLPFQMTEESSDGRHRSNVRGKVGEVIADDVHMEDSETAC